MNCPICDVDLSPLDLVSRTEHVDLCIENGGPTIMQVDDSGRLVAKRSIPQSKQRKICPICDKTFQNITSHFKTCAIKNDLPPHLMLDYWDKINSDSKNPKKFPRDLLDSFVNKCIKEGRIGEQVDFARALSLSMSEKADEINNPSVTTVQTIVINDESDQQQVNAESTVSSQPTAAPNAAQILMQNALASRTTALKKSKPAKKFRLEIVDDDTRRANIILRIDRELAATRSKRYQEALREAKICEEYQSDDCMIVPVIRLPSQNVDQEELTLDKLFHRARMKLCDGSELCLNCNCQNHDLELLMEEFTSYSGKSMDLPTTTSDNQKEIPEFSVSSTLGD